jgi:hypothetical protein
LPAVYFYRFWISDGGLISYGPDLPGLFRQAIVSASSGAISILFCDGISLWGKSIGELMPATFSTTTRLQATRALV